jgi:hypothetical protein
MKPLSGYSEKGLWWFRIFGWGIRWKRTDQHYILFSERDLTFKRVLTFGIWSFRILKPGDLNI